MCLCERERRRRERDGETKAERKRKKTEERGMGRIWRGKINGKDCITIGYVAVRFFVSIAYLLV